ncbi:MAG: MFS transporter [Pseudorhodoplanes sp.]
MSANAEKTLSGVTIREAKVISLIGVGHFMSHLYLMLIPTFLPLIKTELGINYTMMSSVLAAYGLAAALSNVVMGFVVDRFGAPFVLAIGMAVGAMAIVLIGFSTTYWQLVVLMLIYGIGDSVFHPADYAILGNNVSPSHVAKGFAIHNFTGMLGFAVTPIAATTLSLWIGWHKVMIVFGMVGLFLSLFVLLNQRLLRSEVHAVAKKSDDGTQESGWKILLRRPVLLCLGVFIGLGLFGTGLRDYSVTILHLIYSADTLEVTPIVSGFLTATLFGVLAGGWLADKSRKPELITCSVLAVFAIALMTISFVHPPLPLVAVIFAILGFGSGMIYPSRDMLLRAIVPARDIGKAFGFASFGMGVAALVASLTYGFILDHFSAATALMTIGLFALATIGIIALGWRDHSRT